MCSSKMARRLSFARPTEFVSKLIILHTKMINEATTSVQLLSKPKRLPYSTVYWKTKSTSRCTEIFLESQICNLPKSLVCLSIPKDIHLTYKVFSKLPPGLTFLDLRSNKHFAMQKIWHKIPAGLTHLSLGSISDENFAHLPQTLTHLDLPNSDNFFDKHIPHLSPNLTFLGLRRNKITDAGIRHLPPLLTHLDLRSSQKISGDAIPHLPKHLTFLALGHVCAPKTEEGHILLPAKLKSFSVSSLKWNAKLMPGFMPKDLTRLSLRSFSELGTALLENLPTRLISLTLMYPVAFVHEHIAMLPRHLEYLRLPFTVSISDDSLAHLPRSLKSIYLPGEILSDECIKHLPSGITYLSLGRNNLLTDASIAQLPRSLLHLELTCNCNLTDACVPHLPRGLETLDLLCNERLSDVSIPHLPRTLTRLDLSRNKLITDAGIPNLPQSLLHLYLVYNCKITNESVAHLPRSLKTLDLHYTNVTDESIDQAPPFLKFVRWNNTHEE